MKKYPQRASGTRLPVPSGSYQLIQPGDKIAVCISGGKDSMLMAKLMQLLQRFSEVSVRGGLSW